MLKTRGDKIALWGAIAGFGLLVVVVVGLSMNARATAPQSTPPTAPAPEVVASEPQPTMNAPLTRAEKKMKLQADFEAKHPGPYFIASKPSYNKAYKQAEMALCVEAYPTAVDPMANCYLYPTEIHDRLMVSYGPQIDEYKERRAQYEARKAEWRERRDRYVAERLN